MSSKLNRFLEPISDFLLEAGELLVFAGRILREFFRPPFEHAELLKQSYLLGYKTLPLVTITAFILGLVLTLQSRPVLVDFGAEALLPSMVSISVIRELGPVITALLCAGKISSGIGAELGSMKVTEQIDAMEVSGTNPLKYVVATRVLATTFMVPLLVIMAISIALIGSYTAVNMHAEVSLQLFIDQALGPIKFVDVIPALIKSTFFGFFIGLIGSFKGYNSARGTEAVGVAAKTAVVSASLIVFIIDLLAVQVTEMVLNLT
ncbi:MAG: MlaE family ABC transporter permease [Bacteroidota bacterium]